MHVTFRLPYLTGMLLLAATHFAAAESPLPDPIAPAVIGRPLDQIRPARPARAKPPAAKPYPPQQVAASNKAAPPPKKSRPAGTPPVATAPAAAQHAPAPRPVAKQVPDPRAVPPTQVVGAAAQVARFASRTFAPGAYFSSTDQALVRKYYEAAPVSGEGAKWKIGAPVPAGSALTGVPDDLRAALPALPRGYQYVQVDGEVVLVAVQSRTVVDGVSRHLR